MIWTKPSLKHHPRLNSSNQQPWSEQLEDDNHVNILHAAAAPPPAAAAQKQQQPLSSAYVDWTELFFEWHHRWCRHINTGGMEQFLGTRTIKLETSGHLIEQDSSNTNTRQTYCSISMTKRHSDDDQYNARARQFKSFLQVGIYASTSTLFFHAHLLVSRVYSHKKERPRKVWWTVEVQEKNQDNIQLQPNIREEQQWKSRFSREGQRQKES